MGTFNGTLGLGDEETAAVDEALVALHMDSHEGVVVLEGFANHGAVSGRHLVMADIQVCQAAPVVAFAEHVGQGLDRGALGVRDGADCIVPHVERLYRSFAVDRIEEADGALIADVVPAEVEPVELALLVVQQRVQDLGAGKFAM